VVIVAPIDLRNEWTASTRTPRTGTGFQRSAQRLAGSRGAIGLVADDTDEVLEALIRNVGDPALIVSGAVLGHSLAHDGRQGAACLVRQTAQPLLGLGIEPDT
jgi:hypothetical protein